MQEVIRDVTDYKVPMLFYASVEEGDTAAGRVGAVLDECNLNLAYRGAYQDARDLIWDITKEVTGVNPETSPTGEKDDKGNEVMEVSEKEAKYFARAVAQAEKDGMTGVKAKIQALVDERARGYTAQDGTTIPPIAVDIKQRERKAPKPKTLPKEILAKAQAIVAGGTFEKVIGKITKDMGAEQAITPTGDAAKDAEALGWKIKAHLEWRKAKELERY